MGFRWCIFAALLLTATGCGDTDFTLLSYNVAGLPQALSTVSPERNIATMSARLNPYDVVLAQEDFAYHQALAAEATHPHQLPPQSDGDIKSGLSRFSRFPLSRHYGERWEACNGLTDQGSDCATHKGFSVAEHTIRAGGRSVKMDIYNLHMDSGDSPDDRATRSAQVDQLLSAIERRSARKAVIVAGDTNIAEGDDISFRRLLETGGFSDACRQLGCDEPDRIDRILYRSTEWVELEPSDWRLADEFVDDAGAPLSDHEPVAIDFSLVLHPPIPADAGGDQTAPLETK